ncbi:hypothetical protein QMM53_06830 [Leptospira santarosai]|uniref:hypothetical protein n=1 Tax=Leptospira santarosai TaxID=28183 RepID=UPI0024AFAD29|nr:hypothetical protein [Leptospira santarosai]MDI7156261.1 hypothetical protein [Leptospira santarosai]
MNDSRVRREYIAEKIFRAKKKIKYITWLHVPGKEFQPPFDWEFPDGRIINSKTDFEFLPEWVGPICEILLPILAKRNWVILSMGEKISIIEMKSKNKPECIEDLGYDFENIIFLKPISTALIDAYIKIEKEIE